MERSHRLLLVAGLLAALLPAAAATFGTQPGAACKPTHLATQVALVCAPDMPTAECCAPVVAAVDLGGGVPCLCRVAAEPLLLIAGLNATHLLTLYNSCRPGGSHVAAACQVSHVEDRTFSSCPRAHFLSVSVGVECGFRTDDSSCCALLRYTVPPSNMVACLCTLGESDGVTKTGFDITDIVKIYAGCVGVQPDSIHIPKNGCREVLKSAPTPPPANANASSLLPTSSPMLEIH